MSERLYSVLHKLNTAQLLSKTYKTGNVKYDIIPRRSRYHFCRGKAIGIKCAQCVSGSVRYPARIGLALSYIDICSLSVSTIFLYIIL
jgi:hypothetical protein